MSAAIDTALNLVTSASTGMALGLLFGRRPTERRVRAIVREEIAAAERKRAQAIAVVAAEFEADNPHMGEHFSPRYKRAQSHMWAASLQATQADD